MPVGSHRGEEAQPPRDDAWAAGALLGVLGGFALVAAVIGPPAPIVVVAGLLCAGGALAPLRQRSSPGSSASSRSRRGATGGRPMRPSAWQRLLAPRQLAAVPAPPPTVRRLPRAEARGPARSSPGPASTPAPLPAPAPPDVMAVAPPAAPAAGSTRPTPARPRAQVPRSAAVDPGVRPDAAQPQPQPRPRPQPRRRASSAALAPARSSAEESYALACRLQAQGRHEAAERSFAEAAAAGHRLSGLSLGQLAQARGDLDSAMRAYRQVAEQADSLGATACLSLGVLLDGRGDLAGAAAAYRRAAHSGGPAGESAALLLRWLESRPDRAAA